MFGLFKRKNKVDPVNEQKNEAIPTDTDTNDSTIAFREKCMVSVTNLNAEDDEPMGYLCGCTFFVLSDGTARVCEYEDENATLESFAVTDIIYFNDNINNFDPEYDTEVSLMTDSKSFRFTFKSIEIKKRFSDIISMLLRKN